jgi:ubiquinone/menaquinone biosynthesis C-methylase UbiE
MDHNDHVNLLRGGVPGPGGVWADLGSGRGAFTLALAELIGPQGTIYSIDQDAGGLREQERAIQEQFSGQSPSMHYLKGDYTQGLELPPLDGIVAANTLHFQRHKDGALRSILEVLKPGGRLLLVEYNVDRGNPWVPYPFTFKTWKSLARQAGFVNTHLLATRSSRFLGEIYSAVSFKPP